MQKELSDATDDCMIVEFEPETLKVVRVAVYSVADLDVPPRDLADKLETSDYSPLSLVSISPSYVATGLPVKSDCKTRLLAVRGKHRALLERAIYQALNPESVLRRTHGRERGERAILGEDEVEEHYLPKTDKKVLDYHPESQPEIEENHREP